MSLILLLLGVLSPVITGLSISSSTFTTAPVNTAGQLGSQVTLYCTSSAATNDSSWYFTPSDGSTGRSLIAQCLGPVSIPPAAGYTPQQPNNDWNSCNLFMRSLTGSQAGVYECNSPFEAPNSVSALLAVVSNGPVCSTNDATIIIGQTNTMTASDSCISCIPYFNSVFNWLPDNVLTNPVTPPSSNTYISGTYTTGPASPPSVPAFTSVLRFTGLAAGGPPVTATNAPTSTFTFCSYTSVMVLYPPNISITGMINSTTAYVGSQLTCISDAYPAVTTYYWIGSNNFAATGQVITLPDVGNPLSYTCSASNSQGTGSLTLTLNVIQAPPLN